MATHSSILAWEIPWREEPGGRQSIGSQRVRHNLVTKQNNRRSYRPQHSLKPKTNPEQGSSILWRLREVRKLQKESWKLAEGWFMRFEERSHLHKIREQGEAASVDVRAHYPGDLIKVINEGGFSRQQIFSVDKAALFWKKVTLEKSQCLAPKLQRTAGLACYGLMQLENSGWKPMQSPFWRS